MHQDYFSSLRFALCQAGICTLWQHSVPLLVKEDTSPPFTRFASFWAVESANVSFWRVITANGYFCSSIKEAVSFIFFAVCSKFYVPSFILFHPIGRFLTSWLGVAKHSSFIFTFTSSYPASDDRRDCWIASSLSSLSLLLAFPANKDFSQFFRVYQELLK